MLNRLNQYHIMWLFVYFDLPTETKKDRKNYSDFRKSLIKDGFTMIQYSIYARHCSSVENLQVHKRRTINNLPPAGNIIIYAITDKQFGDMEFFRGKKEEKKPGSPQQLELF